MQQPDYRDQSEPDVNDETEENGQSVNSESQKQERSQMEQEKEAAQAWVSSMMNNMTATNSCWRPDVFALDKLMTPIQLNLKSVLLIPKQKQKVKHKYRL